MKIVFAAQQVVPFYGDKLSNKPLGGTETAVIRLAESLQKQGHEVRVLVPIENPPLSTPLYLPITSLPLIGPVDVFVAVRDWNLLMAEVTATHKLFWSGDAPDQPVNIGLADKRILGKISAILAVSDWHKQGLISQAHIPESKIKVLRNGVYLPYFSPPCARDPQKLIFSSTPYRGLKHLPRLFLKIKQLAPTTSLSIISGYKTYEGASPPDSNALNELETIKKEFASIPDVNWLGNLSQEKVAKALLRSSIFVYPNTFAETSCISIMEARAAGCVIVTSALGALSETVNNGGSLIKGVPGTKQYDQDFIDAVIKYLNDSESRLSLSSFNREDIHSSGGWEHRATEFIEIIANLSH